MGTYINPGSRGFSGINTKSYVDKTMLIDLINQTIESENRLTCISRPRRFGKSYAARMLSAYYDILCDSHFLFDDKKIASTVDYEKHINKYNVIYFDTASFISIARLNGRAIKDVPVMISEAINRDLKDSGFNVREGYSLIDNLLRIVRDGGKPFIFIIDEWDAVIREGKNDEEAQEAYLDFLRSWFKNEAFTSFVVAAAYMTGILPIKKDDSQSALSDFYEYTMINPLEYAEFVGFTEKEVENICAVNSIDFNAMKFWCNGYSFPEVGSVYNPNSVMKAAKTGFFDSYWSQISASEALFDYINRDYSGLQKTIAELIGGVSVKVETMGFADDLCTFRDKDDVLTLLVHLGYLSYNLETGTVRIPDEEIKKEFLKSIRFVKNKETQRRLRECDKLFEDTINMKEEAVAEAVERIHAEETFPLYYNREESLRRVIKLAYYTYRDNYLKFEELPSGEGYADIVYIPLPDSAWPMLVIELKWNKSAEGAINQIINKKYPSVFDNFKGDILLVGINYDRKEKKHSCRIMEYRK